MPRWTQAEYEQWKARKTVRLNDAVTFMPLPKPKPAKRVRQSSKPLMNKLENDFYKYLLANFTANLIKIQSLRFKLGNGIWYKPDFVITSAWTQCYEVKGPHAFRGGFENLKVAAGLYAELKWLLVWKDEAGTWQKQVILP